jgi:hypothetical protein
MRQIEGDSEMTDKAQFISGQTYPLKRSKLSGKAKGRKQRRAKWNVGNVRDEAERRPDAIPHLESPKPARVLFGTTPSKAVDRAKTEIAKRKTALRKIARKGGKVRRIREDQHVMICGVASFPTDWSTLRQDLGEATNYEHWKKDTIEFLAEHYAKAGGELVSIIEHIDETYPHLHFYVLPIASPTFSAREVHDGWREKLQARAEEKSKADEEAAFKKGAAGLLDAFYIAVSQKYGHLRHKERRPRLPRSFVLSEKRQAQEDNRLLAATRRKTEKELDRLAGVTAAIEAREQALGKSTETMRAEMAAVLVRQTEIEKREKAILDKEREASSVLQKVRQREASLAVACSSAEKAREAYLEAIQTVGPKAQATLNDIKNSIRLLASLRDRHGPPENAIEAKSIGIVRAAIEVLEKVSLSLDNFVAERSFGEEIDPERNAEDQYSLEDNDDQVFKPR